MNPRDEDQLDERFTEAWRKWANQAPTKSPAEAAARIAARIEGPLPGPRPLWLLAAAAAVLLAVTGSTVLWRHTRQVSFQPPAVADQSRPLGKGEVLIWLDEQTPLYMTFQEPESEPGKGEKQ